MDFPIVWIEWHDATSPTGWQTMAEAQALAPEHVITVGFLISQNKDKVTIAASLSGNECGEIIVIPKSWVTQMRRLSKGNKARA